VVIKAADEFQGQDHRHQPTLADDFTYFKITGWDWYICPPCSTTSCATWAVYENEAALQRALFRRMARPPQDLSEPEWPRVAQELKCKGVTLTLLWQEYRAVHPDGCGYTWFCEKI
jgi:transposase